MEAIKNQTQKNLTHKKPPTHKEFVESSLPLI
jgi:hypothetical protein